MANLDDLLRSVRQLRLSASERVQPLQWRPPADVYRTDDGWLVKFELAGVRPEDIEVYTRESLLIVRGQRCDRELTTGYQFYSMEIHYSRFERCVELPCKLDHSRVETNFQNGMLLVRLRPEGECPEITRSEETSP